ncbi:RN170 ligase, partial [Polypterus senegalus]|nr:RN170 ligase [Polypterus senegalus]
MQVSSDDTSRKRAVCKKRHSGGGTFVAMGWHRCQSDLGRVTSMYNLSGDTRRGAPEEQVLRDIGDYNKRFSGQPRPMSDYLYDMPLFLHLMLRGLFTMSGLIWIFCLRIVVCFFGAVLSLTLSVDVIPEPFCWVLGAVDDLVVVFLVLACMINIHQQMAPDRANVQNSSSSSSSTRDVL